MSVCPKDGTACCDDLCHGGGCIQMDGHPMLEHCENCGRLVDEELAGGCYCDCGDPDDEEFLWIPECLLGSERAQPKTCRLCGCTDDDCEQCIKKTGQPCHWVKDGLCSACVGQSVRNKGVTDRQREILRHALGLDCADEPYRDRYCAAFDSPEEADCEHLVKLGLMTELTPIDLIPYHAFRVTDRGRQIALEDRADA